MIKTESLVPLPGAETDIKHHMDMCRVRTYDKDWKGMV